MATTRVEDTTSRQNEQDALLNGACQATRREHKLTLIPSLKLYPKAVAWSMFFSLAIIMEGYDLKLMGSLFAQPTFQQKYGQQLADGTYQIPAPWQAGLSNGASAGSILGLLLNGYASERFGFRRTMQASLAFITAMIFIPFFAPSIQVLQTGQVLMGIPWGVFQTLTTSYAAEVTPTHLRAYLTTYVNLCWVNRSSLYIERRPQLTICILLGVWTASRLRCSASCPFSNRRVGISYPFRPSVALACPSHDRDGLRA